MSLPKTHDRLCIIHGKPIMPSFWKRGCRSTGCSICHAKQEWTGQHHNPESKQASGRTAVESGQLLKAASLGGRKQGPIQGRKNRESGQINIAARVGGIAASHNRCHIQKGKINTHCLLCLGFSTQEIYDGMVNDVVSNEAQG